MKKRIIPIFVPHRGCPHDCIFCNQKKITGVSTEVTAQDARNIIEECLETIDKDTNVEIAFFGGSFTAIEEESQNELLAVAKEYVDKGLVHEIRMSTRPDCISDSILERLKKYSASIIELGVQSMDAKVLIDSVRGHDIDSVIKSSNLIKKHDIKLGLQMMVGLPSDTEQKCIETAKKFIELKPDCVRIYPTLVVKDTGLETLLERGEYTPFTLEECINIVKKLLVLFYVNNINVIRVGLQATDDIQLGKGVVAGPYHPAFRELVESEMIKDYLDYIVEEKNIDGELIVNTNNKNISKIVGNKKYNKIYMKEKHNIKLKTLPKDLSIDELVISSSKGEFTVNMNQIYSKLLDIYNL
ncbi:elongator complex protein 3 [Intestinibacter sp.]